MQQGGTGDEHKDDKSRMVLNQLPSIPARMHFRLRVRSMSEGLATGIHQSVRLAGARQLRKRRKKGQVRDMAFCWTALWFRYFRHQHENHHSSSSFFDCSGLLRALLTCPYRVFLECCYRNCLPVWVWSVKTARPPNQPHLFLPLLFVNDHFSSVSSPLFLFCLFL